MVSIILKRFFLLIHFAVLFCLILLFSGCASLPENIKSDHTSTMPNASKISYINDLLAEHPGQSGVSLIRNGMEAFLARAVLLKQARHSIDLQYYIWKDDVTGKLLYSLLIEAAERGVKIRLLLDDLGARTPDRYLAALSAHENIEVRLFNPFSYRSNRLFNFIIDFNRLNRRMHNKLFIFDQQVAIVGGRNIGDAYFQASSSLEFNDFDVFIIGNVISQATDAFDHFWLDDSVYDASSIIQSSASSLTALKAELDAFSQGQNNSVYIQSLKKTRLLEELLAEDLKWHWSPVNLIYDKPGSEDNKPGKTNSIVPALNNALADTKNELLIVSPYFVPGKKLVEKFAEMIKTGVKVTILTNSLASTDVTAVHAGYKKYRKKMLRSGVQLYELMPESGQIRAKKHFFKNQPSARSSLHAKSYIFDREKIFIGSFNLDPRSANLNTENGVMIENQQLADAISNKIYEGLDDYAYRLELTTSKNILDLPVQTEIRWSNQHHNKSGTTIEPGSNFFFSLWIQLLSLLPIEQHL